MTQTANEPVPQAKPDTVQATARLMRLDAGLYCLFHAALPAPVRFGRLAGMRVSAPPGEDGVRVSTFDAQGWIGASAGAALVMVPAGGGAVLVTTYREHEAPSELPALQIVRLGGPAEARPAAQPARVAQAAPAPAAGGMVAHIQHRGDVQAELGAWMGESGSGHWLEGFAIQPSPGIAPGDLEYQAILGQDWFSPWVNGGGYCGSRGMALPLLGLRVRLKGAAAQGHECQVEASFTDGSRSGPVADGPVMAATQAPLEAFRVVVRPRVAAEPVIPAPEPVDDGVEAQLLEALPPPVAPAPPVGRVRRGRRVPPPRAGRVMPAAGAQTARDDTPPEETQRKGSGQMQARPDQPVPWWHRKPGSATAASPARSPRRGGGTPRRPRVLADS
ncbi:hypothetical protein ACM0P6_10695 [Komagataeibacter sucrofermentans]|uniref:Hydrophobic W protein n=1 Tax=Komagataeibacter sucrofermentans TaxID=1053551 RepID=A0A318QM68_9PROT|nr:hypothetical protein [Komagataeibacter sucrofermentans]PYD78568.1 hypothetical protein CFR77_10485 [Komagataeibacter sucrofermentans]GBQ52392.1 hypothetical protein AA15973_2757 [Komagataeibacter sucrofermentans DSM 15973]